MKSVNKFWFIAAVSTIVFLIIFICLGFFFWNQLVPENQAVILQIVGDNFGYLLIATVLALGGWGGLLIAVFYLYELPTRKIADEMMIIHSANPSYRIDFDAGKDFKRLATLINEGADRYQSLKKSIDDRIRLSGEALEQEKNILASIISCLSEGVIVCNPSGAILLFNKKAEEFLSYQEKSKADIELLTIQFIGLGRNITCFINRAQIQRAFAEITEKLAQSQDNPGTCFATLGPYGHFLKVEIVPILIHMHELAGFILRINNITQTHTQPDSTFLSSNMVSDFNHSPAPMPTSCSSHFNLPLIPTQIQNVLEVVQSLVKEQYGLTLRLHMPNEPAWIYAGNHYLTSAISFLLNQLGKVIGISIFDCLAAIERDYIHVDIVWPGDPVSDTVLDEWNESFVLHEKGVGYLKLNDILLQHEAEWWSSLNHKSPGKASLRVFIPSAEPSRVRSIAPITLATSRPEFYDFDLLNRPDSSPDLQEQLLSNITYTVIDTETTGLDPLSDEVISIGAVRIVNGRLLNNEIFNVLVDPQREVPEESIKIHGIRPEMLQGQPTIDKVLPLLYQFAENTVLVGHNVAFDMRMFQVKEYVTSVRFTQPVLDTMFLSAVIHPSHPRHSLEAISERLGISITGRHTALGDALAAAEILLKCIPILARNDILTLNDALQASRKTRYAKISY
ncbi:MAG: exonuclease domain-containing protein [Deltaproteobacteria bacterium]|nr:exonuclease domain-containing protein [Deltaproteobacteria bacterium]